MGLLGIEDILDWDQGEKLLFFRHFLHTIRSNSMPAHENSFQVRPSTTLDYPPPPAPEAPPRRQCNSHLETQHLRFHRHPTSGYLLPP